MTEKMPRLREWLNQKYVEHQYRLGYPITQEEFADYLGLSRTSYTQYVNGHRKPNLENVQRIAAKFGDEIYDIVGLARPDPTLQYITARWGLLSPEEQREVQDLIDSLLGTESNQGSEDPQPHPVGT